MDNPSRSNYLALALLSGAILMTELVLTRLFSVTLLYHYGFMAISFAMFGLTAGALAVHLASARFREGALQRDMAVFSCAASLALVAALVIHLRIPFLKPQPGQWGSALGWLALNALVVSTPFAFAGVAVTLALTRFPSRVNGLYAADLVGAALGCIGVVLLLRVTEMPTILVFAAVMASAAAAVFAGRRHPRLRAVACACAAVWVLLAVINTDRAGRQKSFFHPTRTKGIERHRPEFEAWNSFSRVTVSQMGVLPPAGWGMSTALPPQPVLPQRWIDIDFVAGTNMVDFGGDVSRLAYLRYDVPNVGHYLRAAADVFVIGVGGGRDMLAGLAFDQKSVTGVEINDRILDVLLNRYRDFSGRLDENPRLRFINDEARSRLIREGRRYDIIQASLIDTFAATAAGEFALAENAIYTREAWGDFLGHLTDRGFISFSYWYVPGMPAEVYRLVAMGRKALEDAGAAAPERHMMLIRGPKPSPGWPVATLLVARNPFSPEDIAGMRGVCERLGFEPLYLPGDAREPVVELLVTGHADDPLVRAVPSTLDVPTDDRPFFFWKVRAADVLRGRFTSFFDGAGSVLAAHFGVTAVLCLACIGLPLLRYGAVRPGGALARPALYFLSIGTGFMFVEIALMQKLSIFLGHPAYSLSVLLVTVLLSAGAGSLFSGRFATRVPRSWAPGVTVATLVCAGLAMGPVCHELAAAPTATRIAASIGLVAACGFPMGFLLPLGLKSASEASPGAEPWLWGVNGAASVCATIAGVLFSVLFGITATFAAGVVCYLAAWAAFPRAERA